MYYWWCIQVRNVEAFVIELIVSRAITFFSPRSLACNWLPHVLREVRPSPSFALLDLGLPILYTVRTFCNQVLKPLFDTHFVSLRQAIIDKLYLRHLVTNGDCVFVDCAKVNVSAFSPGWAAFCSPEVRLDVLRKSAVTAGPCARAKFSVGTSYFDYILSVPFAGVSFNR